MFAEHFSSSLWDVVDRLVTWIERLPRWLRPAFLGAGLIYAFMIWRGALIVLPIVFLYLLFKDPTSLFHQVLPVLLLYAPGAGFLGGLLYGITDPVLRHLGRPGKILQFILGTWVYCVVLVFYIMPIIDVKYGASGSSTENWLSSAGMGVVFGLALGISATSDAVPNPARSRRIVIGIVIIGAVLLLAMKIAGWW